MTVKQYANKLNKKRGHNVCMTGSEAIKLKKRKEIYKVFSKKELLDNNVEVVIDGVPTSYMTLEELQQDFYNYKTLEIYQYSHKFKKWLPKTGTQNDKVHELGINKVCTYYQLPLTLYGKSRGIPVHRVIYVWFHGEIQPFNENGELMDICHIDRDSSNNHITNLIWDTKKNNIAQRTGAVNQYGLRKKDRKKAIDEAKKA